MEKESNHRPTVEQRKELADDCKRRLKEQLERDGKQSTHREIDERVNRIAERTDRERGW